MGELPADRPSFPFLAGGGELGALIRAKDWSRTSLGPAAAWPQSLRIAVRIMLTSRQPIWIGWGPDLVYLYNDPYRAIIGGKHPGALGQPTKVVWSEIWDVIAPMLSKAMAGDEGTYVESQLLIMERHGYREETYYTFSYSPIPDDDGSPGGIICANTDDTRRVIGERQLALLRDLSAGTANRRSRLDACAGARAALGSNPHDIPFALIFLADESGTGFVLAEACGVAADHPLATRTEAWQPDAVLAGKKLAVVDNLAGAFGPNLPTGAWTEPPVRAAVIPLAVQKETSRGGVLVVGLNPFRLFDEGYRNFLGLVAGQIAAGIVSAESYEAERRRAQALAELDRTKTEFFSNVSHEFRTPLTLMLGPIEDLLLGGRAGLTPQVAEQLEIVHRNSLRLMKLVNTMLDFSRIEAGRTEAHFTPVDLSAYTAELASIFRAAMEGAGLKLIVDCAPLPHPVLVDQEMWEKIVLNLLSNAYKFTLAGEIEVRLELAGAEVLLTVRDTGIGIPAEEIAHVFERFHRVKESRGRTHEGTGIGLALVQELVRLHHGSIQVESVINQGSRFLVRVPFERAAPAEAAGAGAGGRARQRSLADSFVKESLRWAGAADIPARPDPVDGSPSAAAGPPGGADRPRILWADDNADMRDYVQRLLEDRFQVTAVSDGQQALESARAAAPDLVLSDVMMPRLDGFSLMRELRADPRLRTIPIILLSARAGEEARVAGVAEGADDYLVKPFSARELLARVDAHLRMSRLRRESHAQVEQLNEDLKEEMAEREEASKLLLQRTAQFETLLNQAPIGVYVVDSDFRLRDVNPAARPIFGELPELIGRDFGEVVRDLWPQARAEEMIGLFRHTLETGESFAMPEFGEARAGRDEIDYYEWRIDRIPLPDGRFGVVAYFRDISEQVRARLALKSARDDALAANRAKDEFLATLSHELRTPLNPALLVASDAAENKALPEDVREDFRLIANNISLQARLIDDLLDFSRIVHGKVTMERRPLDLFATAQDATATIRGEIAAKGISLTFSFPAAPAVVDGDPVRLRQVFWNVLKNAVKFTPPGGRIEISAAATKGGEAELRISDTGVGMLPEELARVFFPFVQGRLVGGRQERQGGLGLGLAISRMLVENHGGTIWAESAGPNKGATIVIRLPLRSAAQGATQAARAGGGEGRREPSHGTGRPSIRVLFVEDHEPTRDALAVLLKRRGYEVKVASTLEEALRTSGEWDFDLLISDLGLPDGDGCALLSALRRRRPNLMGVAISGFGMEADVSRSHAAGFSEHLTKPISIDSLDRALARTREQLASVSPPPAQG